MAALIAGQLEARNIGSSIAFDWDGKKVCGRVAIIEKHGTSVDVTLATSGEIYGFTPLEPVEIFLSTEAQFALYTKTVMENVLHELVGRPLVAA